MQENTLARSTPMSNGNDVFHCLSICKEDDYVSPFLGPSNWMKHLPNILLKTHKFKVQRLKTLELRLSLALAKFL